ncbi:MAG TPA: TIGR03767 family metallophosphoesterase [Acidimicrobiales bacterium]|nr:TIGR03767 family metallophosphoesterase [Acidimicrobiales bacterium]
MSAAAAHRHTTLDRTVRPGGAGGPTAGAERAYRRLSYGPGEPRLVRDELAGEPQPASANLVPLLHLSHLTDLQLPDIQSPGRFEFLERLRGLPGARNYVPAWRPQEALVAHAMAAMVATINGAPTSPETGAPLSLCISTGDSIDNAQLNELRWWLALMSGGEVATASGAGAYQGVQAPGWQPAAYWCPEPGPDRYKDRYGFPTLPGLLSDALRPFPAPGLSVPWLCCYGNHDGLVLGTSLPTATYQRLLTGTRKPADLEAGTDPLALVEQFTSAPELLAGGPSQEVAADPDRRNVTRQEWVEAHLAVSGWPAGHGYSRRNLETGTAYGCSDIDGPVPVRVILLDTTNLDGNFEGSIGQRQARWLEERLAEAHSWYWGSDGRRVITGARDRLVIVASHHGLDTMVNRRQDPRGLEDDHPRLTEAGVRRLLHSFGNVVLWLNGHRHRNHVQAREDSSHRTSGFWEVSTAALADWPCQSRLVELVASDERELLILCTMLDSDVPADPAHAERLERLASLHRELAANDPFAGTGRGSEGRPQDRNAALRLPAPFSFA